jgi:hypothetical protein
MIYDYVLDYQDYRKAQKLYFRHRRAAGLRLGLWLYVMPALALSLVIADLYLRHVGRANPSDPLLAPTFFFVWMSVWVVALRPWHLRRCYKKLLPPGQKKLIPAEFSFDDQGVVSSIPGRSEGRFFWAGILDYAEDEEMALLFIRKKNFLFVPKRAMDQVAWEYLRAQLQQHRIGKALAH